MDQHAVRIFRMHECLTPHLSLERHAGLIGMSIRNVPAALFELGDGGVEAMGAWRISQGEIPHKDYVEITPPLSTLVIALSFKVFGPTVLLGIILLLGAAGLGIYFLIKAQGFTALAIILIVLGALLFIASVLILIIITMLTDDFVVPIMYLRQLRVLKAWKVLLGLLNPNKAQFFVYIIFKVLLGLAAGMLFIIPCCCLGMVFMPFYLLIAGVVLLALKYSLVWIGVVNLGLVAWGIKSFFWNTVISPITVFFRTYPLVFLEGFGKDFLSITPTVPATTGDNNVS